MNYGNVYPTAYTLGQNLSINDTSRYTGACITLSPSSSLLTLDYATESAGFPFFDVKSLSGPTQIEVKYSEEFPALAGPQSDGPWVFTVGLANTFRVETFNVTEPGKFSSLLQGGQRWSTIRLLTETTIEFQSIGFNSSASHVPASEVPGQLSTSNDIYNGIWDLGARVVQAACIDAGNALSTWTITDDGALIPGQATAQSAKGASFSNYTLTFRTKIVRASTGWRVASGQNPFGPYFVLTSNYPEGSTFVNVNRTLLPANTLTFVYGTSLVQQETVTSGPVHHYPVNVTVKEGKWYTISTTIAPDAYIITLDGNVIVAIPIAESVELAAQGGFSGTGSAYLGSWGFGGFQDSAAYYNDIKVSAQNGTTLYETNLTSQEILPEYAQANLATSVCLDGAKRDRLVWIGDFYHTVKIVASSTLRYDYILGTFEYILARQKTTAPFKGLVPISPFLGSSPEFSDVTDTYSGLLDYQDLFLAGIGDYYRYSGRADTLKPLWNQIKALVSARLQFIDPTSGLIAGSPEQPAAFYFLGPANGTAVTGLNAYALKGLIPLAQALGDSEAAQLYSTTASKLTQALNDKLWNATLGTYSLSTSVPANFSLTGIAWAILSGAANSTQAASSIAKLEELRCGVGYKTSSGDICNDEYELAPNPNGILLDALFKAHRDLGVTSLTAAKNELDSFWSVMVTQNEYYTGASWE